MRRFSCRFEGTERRYIAMQTIRGLEKMEVGSETESALEIMRETMRGNCDTFYAFLVTVLDGMITNGDNKGTMFRVDINQSHITVFRGRRYDKGCISGNIAAHENFRPPSESDKEFEYVVEVLHPKNDDPQPITILHGGRDYGDITILHNMSPAAS